MARMKGKTVDMAPDSKGFYRCPYNCGDSRYPRPKWKTEKGLLGHLGKCPNSPAAKEKARLAKEEWDRGAPERERRRLEHEAAIKSRIEDMERRGVRRCSYCGAERKKEDTIIGHVISYYNWPQTGKSPDRYYCKDQPCAGYDQMAHEG